MMRHVSPFFAALLFVSACDLSTPSQVHTGHIRLMDKVQTMSLPARKVDDNAVERIVAAYQRQHAKSLDVTIGYLPQDAADEQLSRFVGAEYLSAFRKSGLGDAVRISYVPVDDVSLTETAVVSFSGRVAEAPAGCPETLGTTGAENLQAGREYPIGCGTKTAISKMVVNPDDLKGVSGTSEDESRRHGGVVEKYKAGVKNEKLQGINASTVGTGG